VANLGICRKCGHCQKLHRAVLDDSGSKISRSKVLCDLSAPFIGWESNTPEGCPYGLEHMVSGDAIADLAEESLEESLEGIKDEAELLSG
jgi:hypothetical protein